MKNGLPQCKDVPDRPILEFLELLAAGEIKSCWPTQGRLECHAMLTACSYEGFANSIWCAFRHGSPENGGHRFRHLVLAKMKSLIRKGWVSGCCCGCRGDFGITPKGLEHLNRLRECTAQA